jgi:predicted acyltransferase
MSTPSPSTSKAPHLTAQKTGTRLMSLDVFRGATIASMMLVNNPGTWDHVHEPLEHAAWNGWTFTDTIFPFFLWIVGVAIPFSLGRKVEEGADHSKLVLGILRRSLILIAIGFALNSFTYFLSMFLSPKHEGVSFWLNQLVEHVRYSGVLQRIGVCYLIASLIFINTKIRGQMIWTGLLLTFYAVLMKCVPVPGYGAGVMEVHGNFSEFFDMMVFNGHVFKGSTTYDPEGLVSTIPAIASTLFGILTGQFLRYEKTNPTEKTAWLFVGGSILMFAAGLLSLWMPINKTLWTSSYSMFMAGLAMNVFAVYYWLIDVKGYKAWAKPFAIYGMNAITVFILAGLLGRISVDVKVADGKPLKTYLYEHTFGLLSKNHYLAPATASMMWGLILYMFGLYLVAWFLHRRKWFLRF